MYDDKMELYISSGYHITNPSTRIDEIEEAVGSVDTIFVESPSSNQPSIKTRILNFFAAPLLIAVINIWTKAILWVIESLTSSTDASIVTELRQRHNAETKRVGLNYNRVIADTRRVWLVGNYTLVVLLVLAYFGYREVFVIGASPAISVTTLLLLGGIVLFMCFLGGSLKARDAEMARLIEQVAKKETAASACMVTGEFHKEGIEKYLNDSPHVAVLGRQGEKSE